MAERWTDQENDWIARGLMFFTEEQAHRMRATLSGVNCRGIAARHDQ
jgi:hypothetical protein